MSLRVNDVVAALALTALVSAVPGARAEEAVGFGQHQWVPSLAVIGGATMQDQSGSHASFLRDASDPTQPVPLRAPDFGEDRAVSTLVGGAIELMTPAVFSRLRFFASGEVLPVFAPERHLTDEGQPTFISGPEVNSVPATQEDNTHFTDPPTQPRTNPFAATDAKGQGMRSSAQFDQLSYGAKAGFSWSFQYRGRQMRLKPSVGWYRYKLGVKGFMVHPECNPTNRCTNVYFPPPTGSGEGALQAAGFLRLPASLQGSDSGVFDGVGPGIDLEMDAGRFGPILTSLFIGFGGYYIPGDRDIDFTAKKSFNDQLGADTRIATWHTRVEPWLYRGNIGIRFQWLGEPD